MSEVDRVSQLNQILVMVTILKFLPLFITVMVTILRLLPLFIAGFFDKVYKP